MDSHTPKVRYAGAWVTERGVQVQGQVRQSVSQSLSQFWQGRAGQGRVRRLAGQGGTVMRRGMDNLRLAPDWIGLRVTGRWL